jgi:hypothetical protein
MHLHPEDPRLSAYVLGELAPDEAAAVAQAAAADPAVQAQIDEIRDIQRLVTHRLTLPPETLLPKQRENIRRSARQTSRITAVASILALKEKVQPWLIPAAAAAVLAVATLILIKMPADAPPTVVVTPPAPAEETPPPADPVPAALVTQRGSVTAAEAPFLQLPVHSETANLAQISTFIGEEKSLPAHGSIRLEEILNNFPLRLKGVTSIARGPAATWHPDQRGSGMTSHLATLSAETIPCPWKPSATLLIISLQGNTQADCDVHLAFHPAPGNVSRYRLLGFPSDATAPDGPIPTRLAANSMTVLALEIEPSTPAGELGQLKWTTDGKSAPGIAVVRRPAAEPSDDARFAALVCTFGQWLSGTHAGVIDGEIVAALARELAGEDLPPERVEFLKLIDRALHL